MGEIKRTTRDGGELGAPRRAGRAPGGGQGAVRAAVHARGRGRDRGPAPGSARPRPLGEPLAATEPQIVRFDLSGGGSVFAAEVDDVLRLALDGDELARILRRFAYPRRLGPRKSP